MSAASKRGGGGTAKRSSADTYSPHKLLAAGRRINSTFKVLTLGPAAPPAPDLELWHDSSGKFCHRPPVQMTALKSASSRMMFSQPAQGGGQQDSHELLRCLLGGLQAEEDNLLKLRLDSNTAAVAAELQVSSLPVRRQSKNF